MVEGISALTASSPDAERRRLISELYHAALKRDAESRQAFLDVACLGDESLKREVESLFSPADADLIPDLPTLLLLRKHLGVPPTADAPSIAPGTCLGPYEIVAF